MPEQSLPKIVYSCYANVSREGEQFIPEHVFSYQIAGTLTIAVGKEVFTVNEGDFRFSKRNELAKFVKHPPETGDFKSLSIRLDQQTLQVLSRENGYSAGARYTGDPIVKLDPEPLLTTFVDSVMPYLHLPQAQHEPLFSLKVKEAVLILLRANPSLQDILFDFAEPGKTNLEEFMVNNYHFNVGLDRFAYLTGRSLATFKRDFEKIFKTSPSRWLTKRRLEEAYFLIKEKGRRPSDVYLEVGFENLSHFSYAFKNAYGLAPSMV